MTVCQTCGDEGFSNALIYCDNCQIYAIHRYCLLVLPENLDENVVWFCEDCELEKDVKSSVEQCGSESLERVQERNKSVVRCSVKEIANGYSLSMDKEPSPGYCSLCQSLDACCCENVKEDRPFVKQDDLNDEFSDDAEESLVRRKNGNKDQKDRRKNGAHDGECDEETASLKTADCQLTILDASNPRNQICYASQPIQEPIWRGSLNISNKKFAFFDGLVAHLSTLACPRVHEEARMLPRLLSPDMLPRSAVWPKAFEKWAPNYDSIGLYIFPENKSGSGEAFGNLLMDMIHQDLALRAVVQNAEILIFTSMTLPMDYWRFQENLYLWGVFKKKQTPRAELVRVPEEKKGLRKATIGHTQSPVSTLINGSPCSSLMNSPTA